MSHRLDKGGHVKSSRQKSGIGSKCFLRNICEAKPERWKITKLGGSELAGREPNPMKNTPEAVV
jgi:hypothetical protein